MELGLAGVLGDPDGLLEAQSYEAGEEKGAEGVDVEGDEAFADVGSCCAIRVVD